MNNYTSERENEIVGAQVSFTNGWGDTLTGTIVRAMYRHFGNFSITVLVMEGDRENYYSMDYAGGVAYFN